MCVWTTNLTVRPEIRSAHSACGVVYEIKKIVPVKLEHSCFKSSAGYSGCVHIVSVQHSPRVKTYKNIIRVYADVYSIPITLFLSSQNRSIFINGRGGGEGIESSFIFVPNVQVLYIRVYMPLYITFSTIRCNHIKS